jgi:hypothetical protein
MVYRRPCALVVLPLQRGSSVGAGVRATTTSRSCGVGCRRRRGCGTPTWSAYSGTPPPLDLRVLLYEFANMGTLHDALHGSSGGGGALSWAQRVRIALDAARGPGVPTRRGGDARGRALQQGAHVPGVQGQDRPPRRAP